MSSLFLHGNSINISEPIRFVEGCFDLISINKEPEHIYYRHESIYSLPIILDWLYQEFVSSRDAQEILRFIEQMSPCSRNISSEQEANEYCNSEFNGFLGIDFSNECIIPHKKICNNTDYQNWKTHYLTPFENLINILGNVSLSHNFRRDFESLDWPQQQSIIDSFQYSVSNNMISNPDSTNVYVTTGTKRITILELRIYYPQAIRVYFNLTDGIIYLASIGFKSGSDQNGDIMNAEKLILALL
jgi:hypothetical protein